MEEDGKVIWSKTGRGKKELVQSITWRNVYASASTMGWCQQQISTVYIQYCQIGKHSHTNSSIVTLCSVLSKIILQIEKSILSFFVTEVNAEKQIEGVNHIQLKYSVWHQYKWQHSRNSFVVKSGWDQNGFQDILCWSVGYFCLVFLSVILRQIIKFTPVKTELRPNINFI